MLEMTVMNDPGTGDLAVLAGRIRSGDERAENELVRYFSPRIFAMLVARTRDREASRDLLQDVMIAVIRALREGNLRDMDRLVPFVHGTARNLVNNFFRDRVRTPRHEELSDDLADLTNRESLDSAERTEAVKRALVLLDESDRKIVLMTLIEGRKPGDIAERLGLSSEVVRQRKSRAVKKIAEFVRQSSQMPMN